MPVNPKVIEFYETDCPRTLFPLRTNLVLIQRAAAELLDYVYQKITPGESGGGSFLIQERVAALKQRHHLRRTFKLDPIAELFLYEIVYRHRTKFRHPRSGARKSFGYTFSGGVLASPSDDYRDFKKATVEAGKKFKFTAEFDIAAYFNSIYHHDLAAWFGDLSPGDDDVAIFGKFLRQINAGRSIDCLVQGIYPSKVIGSHFLNFVEYQPSLEADVQLRFMDDFVLFSNDISKLQRDFLRIQRLLGERGLSVNPAKTYLGHSRESSVESKITPVRLGLLRRRRLAIRSLYWEGDDDDDDTSTTDTEEGVTDAEKEYLLGLLQSNEMTEEDADLVLAYLRDEGDDLVGHLSEILWKFPYLSKNVFLFASFVDDKSSLLNALFQFVKTNDVVTEYSLFWVGCIVEKHLLGVKGVENLIAALYEHPDGTRITQAKLLEIADKRFGLRELREENLRRGSSDWLSWSSAVGSSAENKSNRNHLLGYFANGSDLNRIIAEAVKLF